MRKRAKVDQNQPEIVEALRRCGFRVICLHQVGSGVPDILASAHGRNVLLEIKMPGEGLTPDEQEFINSWRGPCAVVHTIDEAIAAMYGSEE